MSDARHILSLSGGKDSAALALYMRDRVDEMEYIFHDTGMELPETYDYIGRLEAILGRPIVRTTREDAFDHWLRVYGGLLPSNHRRWCTKMLKLKPFEAYVGDDPVINYVGLRADEARVGYISTKPNIQAVYPFREDGLVKEDIIRLLEESGLGMPPYLDWGRSRSGCYFCFYQRKIEWVNLLRKHPDLFDRAQEYEERSLEQGIEFFWSQGERLADLRRPERICQIEADAEEQKKHKKARSNQPLVQILGGMEPDERDLQDGGCLICFL